MSATDKTTSEVRTDSLDGYLMIFAGLATIIVSATLLPRIPLVALLGFTVAAFLLSGVYMLQPRQAAMLLLFGRYKGTDRSSGLRWANPFLRKVKISLRAHNLNSPKIK